MRKNPRDEWLRDIDNRQRNLVFPATVLNEARLWRNLLRGETPLTVCQIVGISLIALAFAGGLYTAILWQLRLSNPSDSILSRMTASFGTWILVLFMSVGLFLLLRWRIRQALRSPRFKDQHVHRT